MAQAPKHPPGGAEFVSRVTIEKSLGPRRSRIVRFGVGLSDIGV
jgi:hypothetical protein